MADVFRQMQKIDCHDGAPNGGTRTYGCHCCRKIGSLRTFKKWSRRQARKRLKHLADDFIGTRR